MSFMLLGILNSQVSGGGGAAFDLLETQVLASSASSVTFTGLGAYSDYKHLQIRATVRQDGTVTLSGADIEFNGDTAFNYYAHRLQGNGSSVTSSSTSGPLRIVNSIPAGGAAANIFGSLVMDVLDFSSASKNTTVRIAVGVHAGTSQIVSLTSGMWNDTSAVTSLNIDAGGRNYVTGSRFSLYGVR